MSSRTPEQGQPLLRIDEIRSRGRILTQSAKETAGRAREVMLATVRTLRTRRSNDTPSSVYGGSDEQTIPAEGSMSSLQILFTKTSHLDGNPLAPRPPRGLPTSLTGVVEADPGQNHPDPEGARATQQWYEDRELGGHGNYVTDERRIAAAESIVWIDPFLELENYLKEN